MELTKSEIKDWEKEGNATDLEMTPSYADYKKVNLNTVTTNITVKDKTILTGKTTNGITIEGTEVVLCNADISSSSSSAITCSGNVTIHLVGTNKLTTSQKNECGIQVGNSNTASVTIDGDGSLEATGADYGAGIGGEYNVNCGNIVINGGTVTATGGKFGAGIGSGYDSNSKCGNITISGGTITATGGNYAAGIGSGCKSSCGNITINGGTVTATGGDYGAGIGSGYNQSSCGNITITGGTVTAKGASSAAGIGSGYVSSCVAITITGGTIKATGGTGNIGGAGIGSGYGTPTSCGNITISGGTITANAGTDSSSIGCGDWSSTCSDITIESGIIKIVLTKGNNNADYIGKGAYSSSSCGTIKIDDEAKKKIVDKDGNVITTLYTE